jgi:hypothetical protein
MDLESNAFQRAVEVLDRVGDPELLDVYKQFVARLQATVGAEWLDTYASMYQRDRRQLTDQAAGAPVLPEELAVRDRVLADPELGRLYARFIELLVRNNLIDERYAA